MDKAVSVIGIVIVAIGTIFSVWSVLKTNEICVGTAEWLDDQDKSFKHQKKQVIIGISLVLIGSVFQIIGILIG